MNLHNAIAAIPPGYVLRRHIDRALPCLPAPRHSELDTRMFSTFGIRRFILGGGNPIHEKIRDSETPQGL